MNRLLIIVAAALGAALLGGCGTTRPDAYAPAAQAQLTRDLAAVDTALTRHDVAAAQRALSTLSTDTASARQNGQLTTDRAAAITAAETRLLADLRAQSGSPVPTTSQTPPTAPPTTPSSSPPVRTSAAPTARPTSAPMSVSTHKPGPKPKPSKSKHGPGDR